MFLLGALVKASYYAAESTRSYECGVRTPRSLPLKPP